MLVLGRKEGESVVLTDAVGRTMIVTLSSVVHATGYLNLHLATRTNHFAVTLAPFNQLDLSETVEFGSPVGIANGNRGAVRPSLPSRIQFHVPREVAIHRTEILDTPAAKAVAL